MLISAAKPDGKILVSDGAQHAILLLQHVCY